MPGDRAPDESVEGESEVKIHAISSGWLRDLIQRMPSPIVAVGRKRLFRVIVNAGEIALPLKGHTDVIKGFATTCTVAAENPEAAATRALAVVASDWEDLGYRDQAGAPRLEVTRILAEPGRWRWRSRRRGYTFWVSGEA